MTDSTAFFEGLSEPEAPASRRNAVVAAAVAVVVIAAGGFFLLSGGDSSSNVDTAVGSASPRVATAERANTTTKKTTTKAATQLPAVSTVRLGRNPFIALYVVPVVAAVAPPGAGGSAATPSDPVAKTYALKLGSVRGSGKDLAASFAVDAQTSVVKVGGVFGPKGELKLLSLHQGSNGAWTAALQVGDGQPVDAAMGQTVHVS